MQIGFASSVVPFVPGMAASLKISLSLRWSWRQVGFHVPRRMVVARQQREGEEVSRVGLKSLPALLARLRVVQRAKVQV